MTRERVGLKKPYLAALLAWLVPGLGHFYQGRRGKAILYFVCILGLFLAGLALGEGKNVYWRWVSPLRDAEHFRASYLCQFFVGLAALPGLIQGTLAHLDMGPILWGFLAEPPIEQVYALHPKLGKLVEVGWVYTVVAGLLNILAIYDAFEGPAIPDQEDEAVPDESQSATPRGSQTQQGATA